MDPVYIEVAQQGIHMITELVDRHVPVFFQSRPARLTGYYMNRVAFGRKVF